MKPKAYDVILFDLGGVLVEIGGVNWLLKRTGGRWTVQELWVKWLKSPAGRQFERGRLSPEEFAGAMVREFELSVSPEAYLREFQTWVIGPYPGARALLQRLSAQYRLACLSNTNGLHWPQMRDVMGLGRFFTHAFVSHETGLLKPEREAFENVLQTLRCRPEHVLYFDDHALNVRVARELGLSAHQVERPEGIMACLHALGILAQER